MMKFMAVGCVLSMCAPVVTGCTTERVLGAGQIDQLASVVHGGDRVIVTTAAGDRQELEIRALESGALRGVTPAGESVELPVADVTRVEYRVAAPGKTAGLVLGAVFGASLLSIYHACKPHDEYGQSACVE